ncbi:MAG: P-II family nitrogen regulator [Chitinivibrionales bacterium]
MLMIRSMIRPEKADEVMAGLLEAGYPAVTKVSVYGRGKQRGLTAGDVTYDELPKELLLTVIKDKDKDFVVNTIIERARTGSEGAFGDGKIFVTPVLESYTISSGVKEVSEDEK